MKHLKDMVNESLLDDEDEIMRKATWASVFKDSQVAEETFKLVNDTIRDTKPKTYNDIPNDWVIKPYFGVSYFGSTNHGITLGRKGEIYSVLWVDERGKKGDVYCTLLKSIHNVTREKYYELPKELEWLIEVVKSCPNMKKA